MLQSTFIGITNVIGAAFHKTVNWRYIRSENDLRLVFYHGIGNGKGPCFRYLHDETPLENFRKQIDILSEKYSILPMRDAVMGVERNKPAPPKPVCCISFDDGLRTVYDRAYPILKDRGIPATVFLNTATINNEALNWLHTLSYLISRFPMPLLERIINERATGLPPLRGTPSGIMGWFRTNYEANQKAGLLDSIMDELRMDQKEIAGREKIYLDWDQISEMEQNGIAFGSHTANHAPLACFSDKTRRTREIRDAYEIMSKRNKKDGDFVCFPFGMLRDYGTEAVTCAFETGHGYVVEIGNGLNPVNRVKTERTLSRVGLGWVKPNRSHIHTAIELRPVIKQKIKDLLKKAHAGFR